MRLTKAFIFIILLSNSASVFASTNSTLLEARRQLVALCELFPERPVCPGKDLGQSPDLREAQNSIADEDQPSEEQLMFGILHELTQDIFHFSDKVKSGEELTEQEKQQYLNRFKVIDRWSRSKNAYRLRIAQLMLALTSMEWLATYGDPTADEDDLSHGDDDQLAARENVHTQEANANTWALGAFGVIIAGNSGLRGVRYLLNNIKYSSMLLRARVPNWLFHLGRNVYRSRLPIALTMETAAILGAGYYGVSESRKISDLLPTPAHLIRFELTKEIYGADLDFQALWAEKEAEMYQRLLGETVFFSGMFIAGELGVRAAEKLGSQTVRSANKVIRLLHTGKKIVRFFRITPHGIVVGFGAEAVFHQGYRLYRLIDLQTNIANALKSNNYKQLNFYLNRLSIFHSDSMLISKNIVSVFGHIADATVGAIREDSDRYKRARSLLYSDMLNLNLPTYNGATNVRRLICYHKTDRPRPRNQAERRRLANNSRNHRRLSESLSADMKTQLIRALSGQDRLHSFLKSIIDEGGINLNLLSIRRASDPKDYRANSRSIKILKLHLARAASNIEFLETILQTQVTRTDLLFGALGTMVRTTHNRNFDVIGQWAGYVGRYERAHPSSTDYYGCGNL